PGALRLRPVQLEVGVLAPVEEQELAVAGALDPLQELLRHDLIGVDVCPVEDGDAALDTANRLHATAAGSSSRTSTKRPAIAAAASLASLEVPVRRGRAALAGREDVRIHPEAHRAARAPPLEAGALEDPVEPLLLGLALHRGRARDDQRPDAVADALAVDDGRR